MSYQLAIEHKPGYLHVTITGENSVQTVSQYMAEVMRECAARRCPRVLVEERLEGPRLGTFEVFSLVSGGAARAFTACCRPSPLSTSTRRAS